MVRTVKQRVNYLADANFLIRLSEAVNRDDKRSPDWKRAVSAHLTALITMFSQDANQLATAAIAIKK